MNMFSKSMINQTRVLQTISALFAFVFFFQLLAFVTSAQTSPAPRQEKLLNGLKVLLWADTKADNVRLILRVHSGSAFDPQGKEGLMQMLSANLFPNESIREFFSEDLGGSLDVTATYDYIQISASSKPESFLTMLETIASAVSNTQIDKETTARLRSLQLDALTKMKSEPAYVADEALSARFFGTFPYGRPRYGTPESLRKIEFADLLDARQRFLTADNATIAINGNFDRLLAMRALRRYFGSWLKADRKIPSTFRQPEDPLPAAFNVVSPKPGQTEVRYAMGGVSRSEKTLGASLLFTKVLQTKLRARISRDHVRDVFVRNEPHTLPGIITIGFSSIAGGQISKTDADAILSKALAEPVTETELQSAKSEIRSSLAEKDPALYWLDADTYQLLSADTEARQLDSATLASVNAYGEKLRISPRAAVLVNTPAKE
jgi:predicted Zn-dependent peptidase